MKREGQRQDAHTKGAGAVTARTDRKSRQYVNAVSKSRDKSKGNKKLRFCDVSLNNRFFHKIDGEGKGGVSADEYARYLSIYPDEYCDEEEEEEEEEEEGENSYLDEEGGGEEVGGAEREEIGAIEEEDEDLGFCQVGFLVNYQEDGWCVVAEI